MFERHPRQFSRTLLKSTVALIVTMTAIPAPLSVAYAQEASTEDTVLDLDNSDPFALDTIIVTARRQDEEAQDTPVAVTARVGEELGTGQIDDIKDLANGIPNTMFYNNGGPSVSVRGLGYKGIVGLNQEASTGIFVDDIYIGRSWGVPSFLDDLKHAEVVRGSQSTLYGKNTIGGAVNMVSNDPAESMGAELEATIGTNMRHRVRGAVDMPLIEDKLYSRAYFSMTGRDGFVDNVTTDKKDNTEGSAGGRFSLLAYLGDDTTAKFTTDIEKINDDGKSPFAPIELALQHKNLMDYNSERNLTRGGTSLRIDHAFEYFDIKSTTGFRAYEWDLELDGDFSAAANQMQGQQEKQWQISQEVRLSSKPSEEAPMAGDISWAVGMFLMHEHFEGIQFYDNANVSVANASRNGLTSKSNTYSLFGTLGYNITDRLQAISGLRYTREDKDGKVTVASPSGNNSFGTPMTLEASRFYQNVSPELSLNFRATDDILTYAKVSRGFKAGGISEFVELNGQLNKYDPETAWTYEAGTKTSWFDNRLTLNASVFHTKLKDQQVIIYATPFQRVVRNASSSTSKGFELELAAQVLENLRVHGSYGYTKATFDSFKDPVQNADYSGNPLPYAPEHSAGIGFKWDHDISSKTTLFAGTDYNYRSPHTFDPAGEYKQKPQHLVSAQLGVSHGNLSATLWGKNLLDKKYVDSYFKFNGTTYGMATEGRSLGLTVKSSW